MTSIRLPIRNLTLRADGDHSRRVAEGPHVLCVGAYFLALASVAVVVVGGQFPWFIVAPAAVGLLVAHCRHIEKKLDRLEPRSGADSPQG